MSTPNSVQRKSSEKRQRHTSSDRGQPFSSFTAGLKRKPTHHGHEYPKVDRSKSSNMADISGNHLQTVDEACWDKIDYLPLTSEGLRQWEMHAHVDHVFDLVPFWQRGIDAAEKGEVLRLEEFLEKMEDDGGWRTANQVLGMLGGWKATPSERAGNCSEAGWKPYRGKWTASQHGAWESHTLDWARSQRGGWGVASSRDASDATELSHGVDNGWGIQKECAKGGPGLRVRGIAGVAQGNGRSTQGRVKVLRAAGGDGENEETRLFVDAIARQEAVTEERRREMHLFFEMPLEQKIKKIEDTIRILRAHGV